MLCPTLHGASSEWYWYQAADPRGSPTSHSLNDLGVSDDRLAAAYPSRPSFVASLASTTPSQCTSVLDQCLPDAAEKQRYKGTRGAEFSSSMTFEIVAVVTFVPTPLLLPLTVAVMLAGTNGAAIVKQLSEELGGHAPL